MKWDVRITSEHWDELYAHLFPGDGAEHGAVLRCGYARTESGVRLLVREVRKAEDAVDYVEGRIGHRMLKAAFIADQALEFAEDESVYLAVHCHGGTNRVRFSDVDMASHARGYPGLLDLIGGPAVGGLVISPGAAAGDFWAKDGSRGELETLTVVGETHTELTPNPRRVERADAAYERQARLFGDRGQAVLRRQTIAIVGLGGGGSLIAEQIAHLGVGRVILIDPDRVDETNLSRLVGSRRSDARPWLTSPARPRWLRRVGTRLASRKVDVARRVFRTVSRQTEVIVIAEPIESSAAAAALLASDHVFLAADTATARLVVNAVAHQYLVPVTQIGAKVTVDKGSGEVLDVFAVARLVLPGRNCLWCNGLISPARLTEEATSAEQLERQRYVNDDGVHAPSVISLNSLGAGFAMNQWLMRLVGLSDDASADWIQVDARTAEVTEDGTRQDSDCPYCGPTRFARGDASRLPVRIDSRVTP